MSSLNVCDLRKVRKALGKSQSEFAALIGVSTRAIQSYEQGWRPAPAHVQRTALLLLFLSRKKSGGQRERPCWEQRDCDPRVFTNCAAYQFREGLLCWFVTGTLCDGEETKSWEAKIGKCVECCVMKGRLEGAMA